jgi:TonB-dependent SusC/RagA subfamily outer membrane receptor
VVHNVPTGTQLLTAKVFGYRPGERTVDVTTARQQTVRIVLAAVPTVLSGVVTTATGTQRKLEVGNDITTLNVDSIRQVAPITSVTDLLESRVPGLTVLRSSGVPGAPSRLRLRGASSITGNNDPIMIVDGVRVYAAQSDARNANVARSAVKAVTGDLGGRYAAPSPVDQIDPNSIETIEVLKGPSASSLYGSDAANGVIVITTKRGRVGPSRWTATVSQGLAYLPSNFPVQTLRWGHNESDGGYSAMFSDYVVSADPLCAITSIVCNVVDSVTRFQALNLPRWSPLGHGSTTGGSASVSGGVSTLTYALTGAAGSDLGYVRLPAALADAFQQAHGYAAPGWAKRPDKYTTWGGSGQLTAMAAPNVQVTMRSQLFHGLQRLSSLEKQISSFAGMTDTVCTLPGATSCANSDNPTVNAYERATDEQLTFTGALSVSWMPWAWLPLTGTAGLNTTTGHDMSLLPRGYALAATDDTLGHFSVGQKSSTVRTLTVNTIIPGWRGRLRSAVGLNVNAQSTADVVAEQDTLALGVNTPQTLSRPSSQAATGATTYGWFFEPQLTLSQRFFITPGFRLDGGNANGRDASVSGLPAKLTFAVLFPKVNFSWIALDRQGGDVPPLFGVLTLVRPRLALGSAGVQPAPGQQLRLVGASVRGGVRDPTGDTLSLQTLGNTQLRPERSVELEGGIDVEAWHNRINLQLTGARKIQHDAIITVPVAPSVYGDGQRISLNIGQVRNTNAEVTASVTPFDNAALRWTVGGNWSRNDNKVIQLVPRSAALAQVAANFEGYEGVVVGYPLFSMWGKPILGYGDANGDGIIRADEIRLGDTAVYLGRANPAVTAAFNTDLTMLHGRLGVHANFAYQGGGAQKNSASDRRGTFLSTANAPDATPGQQAGYVAAVAGVTPIGLIQTVNWWRFQSLSVNYVVPAAIARRFRAQHMTVALQGSNLGLWTNYRGKDPDVNATPYGNGVIDGGQLPQPRTWSIQLTLGN